MSPLFASGILAIVDAALRLASSAMHAIAERGRDNTPGHGASDDDGAADEEAAPTARPALSASINHVVGFYVAGDPAVLIATHPERLRSTLDEVFDEHPGHSSWSVTALNVYSGLEALIEMPPKTAAVDEILADIAGVLAREYGMRSLIEVELLDATARMKQARREGRAQAL